MHAHTLAVAECYAVICTAATFRCYSQSMGLQQVSHGGESSAIHGKLLSLTFQMVNMKIGVTEVGDLQLLYISVLQPYNNLVTISLSQAGNR